MNANTLNINCDLGEVDLDKIPHLDQKIMPHIHSCNVACGGHAGNDQTMKAIVRLAILHHVSIGAHPSYVDKINFGRKSLSLPSNQLKKDIIHQVKNLERIAYDLQINLSHVKAHGALYNDLVRNKEIAKTFCEAVAECNPKLKIIGLSGSQVEAISQQYNLTFVHEVFADRLYESTLKLRSRNYEDAVLNPDQVLEQFISLAERQKVKTLDGPEINIKVETICLHSDTPNALINFNNITAYLNQS